MNPALAQQIQADTQRLAALVPIAWSHLQGADLLMTGCTGPFGWWLLQRLAHAQAAEGLALNSLTLLTRRADRLHSWLPLFPPLPGLRIVEGDITQLDTLVGTCTHLIHGATTSAQETFDGASSISKFDTLVDGTRAVVRLCRRARPRSVLFLGSGVVYGARPGPISEDEDTHAPSPLDPASGLALGKRAAEFTLACAAQELGFSLTIARCFTFSGPGMPLDVHYALGNFIHQALHEPALVIKGDGTPVRSYLHLGDAAIWLLRMLDMPMSRAPRVYNVGSDQPVSILELAQLVGSLISPGKPIHVLGQPGASVGNVERSVYLPSIERVLKDARLAIWTGLSESVTQTIDVCLNEPIRRESPDKQKSPAKVFSIQKKDR